MRRPFRNRPAAAAVRPVGVTPTHPDDRGGPVPERHAGPGVAAAGAQAASFPIHFGRHPTPEPMADYANRTTLGDVFPERLRPLVEATADLSDRFRSAGHSLYLVGGSVRDAIVAGRGRRGRSTAARTSTSPPTPAPTPSRRWSRGWADAVWTQGKRFGTIGCRRGDQKYEITTHRAEAYQPDSRKPDVAFGDSVEDDLSRRDFTINAMALACPTSSSSTRSTGWST